MTQDTIDKIKRKLKEESIPDTEYWKSYNYRKRNDWWLTPLFYIKVKIGHLKSILKKWIIQTKHILKK